MTVSISLPLAHQTSAAAALYLQVQLAINTHDGQLIFTTLSNAEPTLMPALLRQLTLQERVLTWTFLSKVSPELAANLLDHYSNTEMVQLASALPDNCVNTLFPYLRSSDRRILLNDLPNKQQTKLQQAMPSTWKAAEEASLTYQAYTAAGICKNEVVKLSQHATVSQLSQFLHDDEQHYEYQEWRYVFLHDPDGRYLGGLKLKDVFNLPPDSLLQDYLDASLPVIKPDSDLQALRSQLNNTPHPVLPVVDSRGLQLGVVGFKQLNEALYRQSKQQLLEQSGVFGGDEFRTMPTLKRNIRRLAFLLPSVVLSYAAVSIIAQFESTIAQFALLAAILPLVANLSGAAGNQAVAISIRELAVGTISSKDWLYVLAKEIPIGMVNGVLIGAVLALLSYFTYGEEQLALPLLVAMAYMISSTLAVLIGGALPLLLAKLKLDPAMLSSPLLTTLTDAISFLSVLTLASMILL
ncbi:magnesium transporter [Motilimonas pumila]|uniref:Magnesium transporter n=1 Tax=Motilimonas pumila TaxID=2303987 RepID=A0A418YBX0_9GAMM|nr:magnesium transporter [Motilimonas pumila]RJG41970.1 magnesium transporter [Motilimonas pumila]